MIFNFGSINLDHVYRVPHLPHPMETLSAYGYDVFLGGKGINQTIAIHNSGGDVQHIGAVGPDGSSAVSRIEAMGISTSRIKRVNVPTGQAIIFVDDQGENSIVLTAGANHELCIEQLDEVFSHATPSDWVLLQNETNLAREIVQRAKEKGCQVAYSAAPFVAETAMSILPKTDLLIVNKFEAESLAENLGVEIDRIPVPMLLVTLGDEGAFFRDAKGIQHQDAFKVEVMDTTGAGDTFLGSFLASFAKGEYPLVSMRYALAASAIQVTRNGAAIAIPTHDEVMVFLDERGG
jgi:ribokinase